MFGVAALATMLFGMSPAPASAQGVDLGLAYQFTRFSFDGGSDSVPLGFNVDAVFPLNAPVDLVAEVGWARKSEEDFGFDVTNTALTFGAGVRFPFETMTNFSPYVQATGGIQRDSGSVEFDGEEVDSGSDSNPFFAIDGGVTVPMNDTWRFLAQVGYRRIFADEGFNAIRFLAGVRVMVGGN